RSTGWRGPRRLLAYGIRPDQHRRGAVCHQAGPRPDTDIPIWIRHEVLVVKHRLRISCAPISRPSGSRASVARTLAAALMATSGAVVLALHPMAAAAQQSPEWFVPSQQRPAATPPARPAARAPAPAGLPPGATPGLIPEPIGPGEQGQIPPQQLQVQLPPAPEIPAIPKGTPPPAA